MMLHHLYGWQPNVFNSLGVLAQVDPTTIVDAAQNAGIKTPTTPEGLLYGVLSIFLAGGIGWFYNRRTRSGDAATDASNDFKADSLTAAREQIASLNDEVINLRKANQDLYAQVQSSSSAMVQAEIAAIRLRAEATSATANAESAQASLKKATELLEEIRGLNRAQSVYIVQLQESLRAHNLSFPPFDPKVAITP